MMKADIINILCVYVEMPIDVKFIFKVDKTLRQVGLKQQIHYMFYSSKR